MLVAARRYRRALDAYLRNSGSLADIRAATSCSRPDIDKLLRGRYGFITGGKAKRIESLLPEREREWVRESPRYPISVGQVPCELITPLIEEAFAKYGRTATAEMVGYAERQLFAIVTQRAGVTFEIADVIVSRLNGPGWWLVGEARRWYFAETFGRQADWQRARRARRHPKRRALIAA